MTASRIKNDMPASSASVSDLFCAAIFACMALYKAICSGVISKSPEVGTVKISEVDELLFLAELVLPLPVGFFFWLTVPVDFDHDIAVAIDVAIAEDV